MMPIVKLTNLDTKKSDNVAMALTSNHLNEIRDKISPRSKIPAKQKKSRSLTNNMHVPVEASLF